MTVIFVITKNKYFNVIEETAQTMCMDFINDIVWCIIDCLYQIVPDMFLCISMIDSGNKYTTCFSSVVMMNFKIVYVREVLRKYFGRSPLRPSHTSSTHGPRIEK